VQQFLIRYIAPRTTFAQNMSDAEKQIMSDHAGYWAKLEEQGIALVHRSASEINGAWGIGIIGTENLSRAQVIAANDPVVKHGFHTIEISPISSVPTQNSMTLQAGYPRNVSLLQKK
jgi:uncharacterized protein YciI